MSWRGELKKIDDFRYKIPRSHKAGMKQTAAASSTLQKKDVTANNFR